MNAGLTISSDGIAGEIVQMNRPNRPNGKTAAARGIPSDTLPYDPKLRKLAAEFGCTPDDFSRLSPTGLLGVATPADAKRIGRMAQKLGESCAWTRVDCVAVLRGATKTGEGDKTEVPHETIAGWLGISVERSQKDLRLYNAFPREARQGLVSVTIHEEVAALDGADRTQVLTAAAEKKLSCVDVRELVKAARAKNPPPAGRRGRQPRLPVAPVSVDVKPDLSSTGPNAPTVALTALAACAGLPLPANAPVDTQPAPAGISHVNPSLLAVNAPRYVLQDEDARGILFKRFGQDIQAAEFYMAELIRADSAKGGK